MSCLRLCRSWCLAVDRRLDWISLLVLGLTLAFASTPQRLQAQAADSTAAAPAPQVSSGDTTQSGPGPSGAFLRGVLIPGWGHTVSGSLTRGAFYFGVESISGWMLYKTIQKLRAVRNRRDFYEAQVLGRLAADGITDPELITEALDSDPNVIQTRNLVEGREEQREDWMAAAIFFLLVSGVDAFVSAHLQDFPEPLTVGSDASGERLEVGLRIPVTWFDPR